MTSAVSCRRHSETLNDNASHSLRFCHLKATFTSHQKMMDQLFQMTKMILLLTLCTSLFLPSRASASIFCEELPNQRLCGVFYHCYWNYVYKMCMSYEWVTGEGSSIWKGKCTPTSWWTLICMLRQCAHFCRSYSSDKSCWFTRRTETNLSFVYHLVLAQVIHLSGWWQRLQTFIPILVH